ncbi:MAG: fluoride efflux transporter CrcB [Nocardioidaceae bacterium]
MPGNSRPTRAWPSLRERWDILLVISAGGALGSLARWAVGELLPWTGVGFPWATFVENVSGAFALGLLMVFVLEVWPPGRYVRPFVGVGLLGGYTTFSTYMLETRDLITNDRAPLAMVYLFGTLGVGLVGVWSGIVLARTAVRSARVRRHRDRPTDGASEQSTREARSRS